MQNKWFNKWLFETSDIPYCAAEIRSDLRISLRIKKRLYSGKSPYQKIEIYDTFTFGRILVLDKIFQTSEKDEFVYHEMLCHLPMFYSVNPKKVLIIGGGDGGTLKEVLKHPIEKAWMVEIDRKVVEVSKKYLPSISKGAFEDKRTELVIDDGIKFIQNRKNFFDVIILDLSDPWGPAQQTISIKFYNNVKKALKRGGVISVQAGCLFDQPELVSIIFQRLKKVFSSVIIHKASIPLYSLGEFSFSVASDADLEGISLEEIKRKFRKLNLNLKYYNPKIHFASAVLPKYLIKKLKLE